MEVVLFQPEIPQNTGNIVRTCSAVGASLTLVRPLGFSLASRHLKRAGLDYWAGVEVNCIDSLEEKLETTASPFFFLSSKAERLYTDIPFEEEAIVIFGAETSGLPEKYWARWPERFFTLPMKPGARCLNLSNAVAIVLYEGWRQLRHPITQK